MINARDLIFEITGDERVFDPSVDLVEAEILDSFAVIELFTKLEDEYGIVIYPTRIDRSLLRSCEGIDRLIAQHSTKSIN